MTSHSESVLVQPYDYSEFPLGEDELFVSGISYPGGPEGSQGIESIEQS